MKYVFIILISMFINTNSVRAGSGCCSWHGGQDYCDTTVGKWVCKDGTYSPSCRCYNDTLTDSSNGNNIINNNYNNNLPITNDSLKENNGLSILEKIISILFFAPIIFSSLLFLYIAVATVLPEKYLKQIKTIVIKAKNKFKN